VANPNIEEWMTMARRTALVGLVVALGLTLTSAHATPSAYVLHGSISAGGSPVTYQATGALCLTQKCGSGSPFQLSGLVTKTAGSAAKYCLGAGYAMMSISWFGGGSSSLYLDIVPLSSRVLAGVGSVLSGARSGAKVTMTLVASGDPCRAPATLSGGIAFNK
jgi:hypothetical protein